MANFPTSPKPDYPIEETFPEPEVLISVHRDGSEQRRLKGTGQKRGFKLNFGGSSPITQTQYGTIMSHYTGQNGKTNSFNWVHPETGTTYLVRYAEKPSGSLVAYNCWQMSVEFREVLA